MALLWACDLPPGFNEVKPEDVDRRAVGTADVEPIPGGGDLWSTDFVGWQFGGGLNCVGFPGTGTGGGTDTGRTPGSDGGTSQTLFSTIVQVWDGVEAPCDEAPEEGDRVLQIELSDNRPGTYTVADRCVAANTARVIFGEIRGGVLFSRLAVDGSVTVLGLEEQVDGSGGEVLEGAFSVRFGEAQANPGSGGDEGLPTGGLPVPGAREPTAATGGFTSGGFRGAVGCF